MALRYKFDGLLILPFDKEFIALANLNDDVAATNKEVYWSFLSAKSVKTCEIV
ncbi:hypothetical protein [Pedobacter chinensis]|uniref:hypothetical protein n=1 Tax=Pedobacter chinensis TaxID=2282421 RepID=UPI0013145C44|nr:hypothetical protein [Pedobacter chinensis]